MNSSSSIRWAALSLEYLDSVGLPFSLLVTGIPWFHDLSERGLAPGDAISMILSGTRLTMHAKYIATESSPSQSLRHGVSDNLRIKDGDILIIFFSQFGLPTLYVGLLIPSHSFYTCLNSGLSSTFTSPLQSYSSSDFQVLYPLSPSCYGRLSSLAAWWLLSRCRIADTRLFKGVSSSSSSSSSTALSSQFFPLWQALISGGLVAP